MPELKDKKELAAAAKNLAQSFELVQRANTTFIPVDWKTYLADPPPAEEDRIWLPLTREEKLQLANRKSNILFSSDAELRSFDFMMRQIAIQNDETVASILIKTAQGLRALNGEGLLVKHDGSFTPNYVKPMLNEDAAAKEAVFKVIVEWLGGDEDEAHSLLHHLATSLAPNWSAVKYIILLGEGRNGKGLLLKMLAMLFGAENISSVSRQSMAEFSPTCIELNNKLINIVYDGQMSYIKDSAAEKTLIAGEPVSIRLLYESGSTIVQTNALFIEALNTEPKARDKSSALQKRLVRFKFPNVYAKDLAFEKKMTAEPMLGALLSLLIDHYVKPDQIADKLSLTKGSMDLQMEQVWLGSPVLQFLEHLSNNGGIQKLPGTTVENFMASFKPWAEQQGMHERSDGDLLSMLKISFELGWKSVREAGGKPTSKRVIKSLKKETEMALELLKGGAADDSADTD